MHKDLALQEYAIKPHDPDFVIYHKEQLLDYYNNEYDASLGCKTAKAVANELMIDLYYKWSKSNPKLTQYIDDNPQLYE